MTVKTEMTVLEHLQELRKRLMVILFAITTAMIMTYWKITWIIRLLIAPFQKYHIPLAYFSLVEGFMTRIKIALVFSLIITSPIMIYQMLAFIRPALTSKEKRILWTALFYLLASFIAGFSFGFLFVLPAGLNFFIPFGRSYLFPVFLGNAYFSFVMMNCLVCGFIFLLPFILVLLGKLGILNSQFLKKRRRTIFLVCLAIASLLAPATGWFTMVLMVLPVLIFYEVSIWIIYFAEKRALKKMAASREPFIG